MEYVTIHPNDTVKVCLQDGHKYARRAIRKGQPVIKYGFPIGIATADIAPGERVHCHNLRTALGGARDYAYTPKFQYPAPLSQATIDGFARPGGQVGIRNDIWIVPTVGCVNSIARALADRTDTIALTHPYGCSQLGDDLAVTQRVLAGLVHHPNAGGVLVLGLGCENNNIQEFKKVLGTATPGGCAFSTARTVPMNWKKALPSFGNCKPWQPRTDAVPCLSAN